MPTHLAEVITPERIAAHLPPPGTWRPVPGIDDRDAWRAADPATAAAVLSSADELAGLPWPGLPATLVADYERTGTRIRFEAPYFARRSRLATMVLAAAFTAESRWIDEVLDGVWLLCEETSWCIPAHEDAGVQEGSPLPDPELPVLDLFAAETGALLAWTHLVAGPALDRIAPVVTRRLRSEVERRILTPYRERDWYWYDDAVLPLNNWNAWIHCNVIVGALLLETDRDHLHAIVAKAVRGLGNYVAAFGADGGCDEGVGYWWQGVAHLAEALEALYDASHGRLDAFGLPVLREMGEFLPRMHIGGDWYVNFGDGPPRFPAGSTAADLVHRFGRRVGSPVLQAQGRSMRVPDGPVASLVAPLGQTLAALFDADWIAALPAEAPQLAHAWLDDLQVLTVRERPGRQDGLFLAAKGGTNGESHNHNDVGSFVVGLDGRPALVDAGVGEYTRATFGPDRYDIWTMQSSFHNLPEIDGRMQAAGRAHAARDVSGGASEHGGELGLDLAATWPDDVGVLSWRRTVSLHRDGPARVVVDDAWRLARPPGTLTVNLMAHGPVDEERPGRLVVGGLVVTYDARTFEPRVEVIELTDGRLRAAWGDRLHRIVLVARAPAASGAARLIMTSAASDPPATARLSPRPRAGRGR